MRLSRLVSSLFLLAGGLVVPLAAHAQTIFTDNFNGENGGTAVLNYNGFANWDVLAGTVDLIGNGNFDLYPGNGLFVDLVGSTFAAGTMQTKTAFALPTGNYTLSFLLGKNGGEPELMEVSVGNVFSSTISDSLNYPAFVQRTFNFSVLAPTSGAILFEHTGADLGGYVIDNVSLVRNVAAVAPEPATAALLLGLLPLAARRRKK
jgi:hypothetical protein